MTENTPDRQAPSDLEQVVALKKREIAGNAPDQTPSTVDEKVVAQAESALTKRLEELKLGGVYQEKIEGKLSEVKTKWVKKINGIKAGSADTLKTETDKLVQDLQNFTEQKDVKDLITVFDPFFRNKESVVPIINLEKYKKNSGHWKAINARLYSVGITKNQITALQKHFAIKPDGQVGPQTITSMFKMYGEARSVEFDDSETTLKDVSIAENFDKYVEGSDKISAILERDEWKKLEAEWAGKYTDGMTLDELVKVEAGEEAAKRELIKRLMGNSGDASSVAGEEAVFDGTEVATPAIENEVGAGVKDQVSESNPNLILNPELIEEAEVEQSVPGTVAASEKSENEKKSFYDRFTGFIAGKMKKSGPEPTTVASPAGAPAADAAGAVPAVEPGAGEAKTVAEITPPTPEEMDKIMKEKFGEILGNQDKFALEGLQFSSLKYNPESKTVEMIYPQDGANQMMILSYNMVNQKTELKFAGNGTLFIKDRDQEGIDAKQYLVDQWKKINGTDMPDNIMLTYLKMRKFDEKDDLERGTKIKEEILAGTRDSVTSEELEVLKRSIFKEQVIRFEELSQNVTMYSVADVKSRYKSGDTITVTGAELASQVEGEDTTGFLKTVRFLVGKKPSVKIPRPVKGDIGYNELLGFRMVTEDGRRGAEGQKDFPGKYKTIKVIKSF